MNKMDWFTKTLALVGTIFVTLPVLAPIILSIIQLISSGNFLFDFLMPAELGWPAIFGAGLLIWASIRSRFHLKRIIWCTGIAIILVFGSQWLAVITGLASGRIDTTGWQYIMVVCSMIGYDLAVIGLAVSGGLLCRHLFKHINRQELQ
jgi:hypothetical protein